METATPQRPPLRKKRRLGDASALTAKHPQNVGFVKRILRDGEALFFSQRMEPLARSLKQERRQMEFPKSLKASHPNIAAGEIRASQVEDETGRSVFFCSVTSDARIPLTDELARRWNAFPALLATAGQIHDDMIASGLFQDGDALKYRLRLYNLISGIGGTAAPAKSTAPPRENWPLQKTTDVLAYMAECERRHFIPLSERTLSKIENDAWTQAEVMAWIDCVDRGGGVNYWGLTEKGRIAAAYAASGAP